MPVKNKGEPRPPYWDRCLKVNEHKKENPFRENGLYFGYPECCIEGFWNMLNGSGKSKPQEESRFQKKKAKH